MFVKMDEKAILPMQAHPGEDAGYDLFSIEYQVIAPGQTKVIDTGVGTDFGPLYVALICSRSGMAAKESVFVLNSPGIIDSGFKSSLKCILHNAGTNTKEIKSGDRIAQVVFTDVAIRKPARWVMRSGESLRGQGGLGSTGK